MNTKEAIQNKFNCIILFLKQLKIDNLPLNECAYDVKKKCDDIIELLKRGEKFEKIVEELKEEYGLCTIKGIKIHKKKFGQYKNGDFEWEVGDIEYLLKRLEQKYFPKE